MPRIISILSNSLSLIHIMMSLLSVHFHLNWPAISLCPIDVCINCRREQGFLLNLNPDDGGGAPNVKIANDRKEKADGRLIRMAQRLDVVRFTEDLQSIASSSLDIKTGCFSSSDGK